MRVADDALFGGAAPGAGRRLVLLVAVLCLAAGTRSASLLAGLLGAGLVLLIGGRPSRWRVALVGIGAVWATAVAAAVVAAGGAVEAGAALGLRMVNALVWIGWFGAAVSWPAFKRFLRRARCPETVLDAIDAGVAHGLVLLDALERRRQAVWVRLGQVGARRRLAAVGPVLAGGVERALDRSLLIGDTRALRAAPLGPPRRSAPAIDLSGVSAAYPDGVARLEGIDLQVGPAEWVLLAGASGSGKSTLLRVIAGLLAPSDGRYVRFGRAIGGALSGRLDGRVALVLQEPDDQLLGATPTEDVAWGLRQRGMDANSAERAALAALAALRIEHLAGRPVHRLSFGERKRVAMAAALASRPELLLCDEPTAGLDAPAARRLVEAVEAAASAHSAAVVWASHDLRCIPARVARVVLLSEGRVVFDGPREQGLTRSALRAAGLE